MRHSILSLALFLPFVLGANVVIDQVAESFPWSDPFGAHPSPPGFRARCEATATFRATQHVIREIHEPLPVGLAPWADAIRYFFGGRPFPGGWNGVDPRGADREVVKMEYADVPAAVKEWIVEQKKGEGDSRWLFGVYEKPGPGGKVGGTAAEEDLVVLFAAGAVYEVLPLWVAGGSECEGEMLDLGRYSSTPEDGGVVAWVVGRTVPDWGSKERDVTFTVKAHVLERIDDGSGAGVDEQAGDEGITEADESPNVKGKDEL
ncbi:phenylacetaldoxime dehydratase [Colletotrichum plurivorum]|uniref:Phenylacetaldoxime dehydratase n=1 Tax=Colletotrichum plurivorum TaxID=2175906 RepID=A0A8H6KK30_9PEZI|nr:phenylacetaldoxime dehydratase [Colletotrichum plurivorum]